MRSRVNSGDEWPGGSSAFQITFFCGPNSTGRLVDVETPLPFGPRNCGQSSAKAIMNGVNVIQAANSDESAPTFLVFNFICKMPLFGSSAYFGWSTHHNL